MPRQSIPLAIADLSQFSRALGAQLAARPDKVPSHLSLMNMLARAAGFRNFQHLRAGAEPEAQVPALRHVRVDSDTSRPSAYILARFHGGDGWTTEHGGHLRVIMGRTAASRAPPHKSLTSRSNPA